MFGRDDEEGFSGAPSVLFLEQGNNYMVFILLSIIILHPYFVYYFSKPMLHSTIKKKKIKNEEVELD